MKEKEIDKILSEYGDEYEPQTLSEKIMDYFPMLAMFILVSSFIFLFFWCWQLQPDITISFGNVFVAFVITTFAFVLLLPIIVVIAAGVPVLLQIFVFLLELIYSGLAFLKNRKTQNGTPKSRIQKEIDTLSKFSQNVKSKVV